MGAAHGSWLSRGRVMVLGLRRNYWSWHPRHSFLRYLTWSGCFWAGAHGSLDPGQGKSPKTLLMKMRIVTSICWCCFCGCMGLNFRNPWAHLLAWLPLMNDLLRVLLCCKPAFDNLMALTLIWRLWQQFEKTPDNLCLFLVLLDSDLAMTKKEHPATSSTDLVISDPLLKT